MNPHVNALIRINDIRLKVLIGTMPHERDVLQELAANISFEYDASLAAQTDALGHAVDYAAVHASVVSRVAPTQFFLLERLAAFILDIIMEDTKILSATVTLEKPAALTGAKSVAVTMSTSRSGGKPFNTNRCC